MNRRQEAVSEAKVESVTQHISSLKDIVAAGLRSAELTHQMLSKLPAEHRMPCADFSTKLRTLLFLTRSSVGSGMDGGVDATATPTSPRVEATRRGSALSPAASGRSSPTPVSPNGNRSQAFAAGPPNSPCTTLAPVPNRTELRSSTFRHAVLGSCDAAQEIGMETIPRPGIPGIMSGDLRPMRLFLQSNPDVLDYIHAALGGNEPTPALEALSFANMMWVQTHPNDFEAASIDSARIAAGLKRKTTNLSSSSSSSTPGSGASAPSGKGGPSPGATLEDSMKYLLWLNLSLRFPPSQLTELLQMRDDRLHLLKELQQELSGVVTSSGVAVMQFPSVVKTMNALDAALSGTSLLSISAKPADIHSILFNRYSALVVDLGFVLHDHDDVAKIKKLNAAVEKTCGLGVEALKQSLRALGEMDL